MPVAEDPAAPAEAAPDAAEDPFDLEPEDAGVRP